MPSAADCSPRAEIDRACPPAAAPFKLGLFDPPSHGEVRSDSLLASTTARPIASWRRSRAQVDGAAEERRIARSRSSKSLKTIAVIGPTPTIRRFCSATTTANQRRPSTPLEGIRRKVGRERRCCMRAAAVWRRILPLFECDPRLRAPHQRRAAPAGTACAPSTSRPPISTAIATVRAS